MTLSGYAPNYWEKEEAELAAKRVQGVRGVANDIAVKLSATHTAPEIARDACTSWRVMSAYPPIGSP